MNFLTPEILIAIVLPAIGLIIWLVRLEGLVKNNTKDIDDHVERLNLHSDRLNTLAKDGDRFVNLAEGIRKDMQAIVNNIRWILKVANIDVPADIFDGDEKK